MNIILPNKLNSPAQVTLENPRIITVVGANGSGKTRFGSDIEERYHHNTHRITAQKSLSMPVEVHTTSKERAQFEFSYGAWSKEHPELYMSPERKKQNRWKNNLNTSLLDDYDKLMILLHTEEYEKSLNYKEESKVSRDVQNPTTKLDIIQRIWGDVFPYRDIIKEPGSIKAKPKAKKQLSEEQTIQEQTYNASEMSDGERVVFYLIGGVLCVKENSIIIIDEPELHLHKSITKTLWDKIEQERPDCVFIYLTHDIDFASTRTDSTKIWLKSYETNNVWDYDILENQEEIPDNIYLEILGSRKPILFIEGTNKSSIDIRLYPNIFPEFTVKPLGSCSKVMEATKAFGELKGFHHLDSKGIIDRDRRTDEEVAYLSKHSIYVPDVSEVENLLLKESIVKTVASKMDKEPETVFTQVKQNVIEEFSKKLDSQVLLHTKYLIRKTLEQSINNKIATIEDLDAQINQLQSTINSKAAFENIKIEFLTFITNQDYDSILKVYNHKGLLSDTKAIQICDLKDKEAYLNIVSSLLKKNGQEADLIRKTVRDSIGL